MSVNQDKNTLVTRKRQIPEKVEELGFSNKKVQAPKSSRGSYIGKTACDINKISKYLNGKVLKGHKVYICIEKLDKYILKIKTVSYLLQRYVSEKSAKKEICNIYTDQRFRIIEVKKFVEAHDPVMPYLTKTTKDNVFSASAY